MSEYDQALRQLKQAQQNFDNADPQYIDIAIQELAAAEMRVDLAYKQAQREGSKCLVTCVIPR